MLFCVTVGSAILLSLITLSQCCRQSLTTTVANVNDKDNATTSNDLHVSNGSCIMLDPNDYVDQLIVHLKNKTIDTIPLPDDPGSTSLKEGQVWGLSSLKRKGNASVWCNQSSITIEVLLSFEQLKGCYKWEKKVLKTFSGFINITVDSADILFRVSQQHSNDTGLTLEELSIKNLSGIHTEVTGMGIITWSLSLITKPAANLFKKSFVKMIEGPLKDAIRMELRFVAIPLY